MATLIEYAPNEFVVKKHVARLSQYQNHIVLWLVDGTALTVDKEYMPIVREHFPIAETSQRNRAVIDMLKMVDDVVDKLKESGDIGNPILSTMLNNLPLPSDFGYKFTEPVFARYGKTASERVCLSFFGWGWGRFCEAIRPDKYFWRVTREELVDGEWKIIEYYPPLA